MRFKKLYSHHGKRSGRNLSKCETWKFIVIEESENGSNEKLWYLLIKYSTIFIKIHIKGLYHKNLVERTKFFQTDKFRWIFRYFCEKAVDPIFNVSNRQLGDPKWNRWRTLRSKFIKVFWESSSMVPYLGVDSLGSLLRISCNFS